MDIRKTSIERNPFLGLFLRASDTLLLAPTILPSKILEQAEAALGVRVVRLLINQSNLLGTYCALNSNGVVLPNFAEAAEVNLLKEQGLNLYLMDSRWGAAGNNILVNDKAALVHPGLPREQQKGVQDCLGVEVVPEAVSGIATVGSINIVTNKGLLAFNRITEIELKRLERLFHVSGSMGSANLGVPFVGICAVANSKGALIGDLSSGVEVQRAYQALHSDTP